MAQLVRSMHGFFPCASIEMPANIHFGYVNVNPGLINPKRLCNWEGTIFLIYIYISNHDYWRNTPPINKPRLLIRA